MTVVVLTGCAGSRPPNDPWVVGKQYADEQAVRRACPSDIDRKEDRDVCAHTLLAYVDRGFDRYRMSLLRRGRAWDYAFDWASLGVATATAVVGGKRSKTNLATAATFVGGAEGVIGKNAPAASAAIVIQQMNGDRAVQRDEIERALGNSMHEYPMAVMIADIQRYYYLGTVDVAMARLLEAFALINALREATAASDQQLLDALKALSAYVTEDRKDQPPPNGQ